MVSKKTDVKNKCISEREFLKAFENTREYFSNQFIADWIDQPPKVIEYNKPPPCIPFNKIEVGRLYTLLEMDVQDEVVHETGQPKITLKRYKISSHDVFVTNIIYTGDNNYHVNMTVVDTDINADDFKELVVATKPKVVIRDKASYSDIEDGWGLRYKS